MQLELEFPDLETWHQAYKRSVDNRKVGWFLSMLSVDQDLVEEIKYLATLKTQEEMVDYAVSHKRPI